MSKKIEKQALGKKIGRLSLHREALKALRLRSSLRTGLTGAACETCPVTKVGESRK